MANKRPLVIVDGVIRQLSVSDNIEIGYFVPNLEETVIHNCAPIAVNGEIAIANDPVKSYVVGLAVPSDENSLANRAYQSIGVLSASDPDWKSITENGESLLANTNYYLSASSVGKITSIAPTAIGSSVVRIGIALTQTELFLFIQPPIFL